MQLTATTPSTYLQRGQMAKIVLYGASDDLIEVESDSFPAEEFSVDCDSSIILGISDGTLLRVRYDEDGIWRFTQLMLGSANLNINVAIYDGDKGSYSDTVTLTGDDLRWVVYGLDFAR